MNDIGERIERACAHWLAVPVFTLAFLASLVLIGVEPTNILISYQTIVLLLLTVGRDRRDRAAMHAKLDDLEIALPEADSGKAKLEEQPEEAIEAVRKGQVEGGD